MGNCKDFNEAVDIAWANLQSELTPYELAKFESTYESAREHIAESPDYAAKTIAIGLSKKVKYIERALKNGK